MSEPILNEPGIGALVCKSVAACVPEHVRMGVQGQATGTVFLQKQIDGRPVQRLALFADKESLHRGWHLHPRTFLQPGAYRPQFLGA